MWPASVSSSRQRRPVGSTDADAVPTVEIPTEPGLDHAIRPGVRKRIRTQRRSRARSGRLRTRRPALAPPGALTHWRLDHCLRSTSEGIPDRWETSKIIPLKKSTVCGRPRVFSGLRRLPAADCAFCSRPAAPPELSQGKWPELNNGSEKTVAWSETGALFARLSPNLIPRNETPKNAGQTEVR